MPNPTFSQSAPDGLEAEPFEFLVTGPARDKQAENDQIINQALDLAGINNEAERGWLKMRVDVIGVIGLESMVRQVNIHRQKAADYFAQLALA